MATFYKGAGIGTHWHIHDSRRVGFTARAPETESTTAALIDHITKGTLNSPYISLTRSYAVAWDYAMRGGTQTPILGDPGYVYEIEIDSPLPLGLEILDPIKEVALNLPSPIGVDFEAGYPFYQHNGLPTFLLGVVSPGDMSHFRIGRQPQPPGPGLPCPPNLTPRLEALVNALRDAEILFHGSIPSYCVKERFEVVFS
ncbi:hypothetical protein C6496_10955 [Candidatus Poribacteria bacterium]|nr:MAG: hypothetical protein C6496_10955 [Candidatus Poribacteria bacterium]